MINIKVNINALMASYYINAKSKKIFAIACFFLLLMSPVFTQTAKLWNGSADSDWNNASNWFGGVPDASNFAVISSLGSNFPEINGTVTLHNIVLDPSTSLTIGAGGELNLVAQFATGLWEGVITNRGTIENNGTLTISSSASGKYAVYNFNQGTINNNGTFEIKNAADEGVNNEGTINHNSGTFSIGTEGTVGGYGIDNSGTLTTESNLNIDRTDNAINNTGTLNHNSGTLAIGATNSINGYGLLLNNGKVTTKGNLQIDNTSNDAIEVGSNGELEQQSGGTITIGGIASIGGNGIDNDGTVSTGATVNVDQTNIAILNNNVATFANSGNLNLNNASNNCLRNNGTFNHNAGTITIDNIGSDGISNGSNGVFTNVSTINIGQNGSIGDEGVWVGGGGTFNNNNGATLNIYRSTESAIFKEDGTFDNRGTINIGQGVNPGDINLEGILLESTFTNYSSGILRIDNCGREGIRVGATTPGGNSGNFSNSGQVLVGTNGGSNSISNNGIQVAIGGFTNNVGGVVRVDNTTNNGIGISSGITFSNAGEVTVGSNGTLADNGINVESGGTFDNTSGAVTVSNATNNEYNIQGSFNNSSGTIKGEATFSYGTPTGFSGTLAPGTSPGIFTFDASQTFTSGSDLEIEINGTTVGTQHDRLVVNGTATLGGNLSVNVGYAPTSNDRIVFLQATSISGVFSSTVPALPADWALDYSVPGEVALQFSGILPVELVDFSVSKNEDTALLRWQTASEINSEGFEIEHSTDGRNWEYIEFIEEQGNSTDKHNYTFLHKIPSHGMNYYRLRQVDFDGQWEYSEIRSVEFGGRGNQIRLFPNPASFESNIQMVEGFENASIKVFDLVGRIVFEKRWDGGESTFLLDVSEWELGQYFLELKIDGQQKQVQKLMVTSQ